MVCYYCNLTRWWKETYAVPYVPPLKYLTGRAIACEGCILRWSVSKLCETPQPKLLPGSYNIFERTNFDSMWKTQ